MGRKEQMKGGNNTGRQPKVKKRSRSRRRSRRRGDEPKKWDDVYLRGDDSKNGTRAERERPPVRTKAADRHNTNKVEYGSAWAETPQKDNASGPVRVPDVCDIVENQFQAQNKDV